MSHRDRLTILGNSHQQNLSQKPRVAKPERLRRIPMRRPLQQLSHGKVCRQFVGSGCTAGSAVPPYGRRCPASDLEWFRCLPAPPDLRRQTSLNEPHEPWSREPRDSEGRRECVECSKMVTYGVRDGSRTVGLDTHRRCVARWTLSCRVVGVGQGGRLSGSTSKVDERRPSGP